MASITFTDAIGAATLTNGKPSPADRFSAWVPVSKPIGESARRQSDGAMSMFVFRTDHGATFQLERIPVATHGGVRPIDVAARLVAWLLAGGTCAVNTGDVDATSYATCGLMPESAPALTMTDRRTLEYSLSLSLINLAGSPVPMACHYVP